jgi:glycyl-tRNA synthetase beta chain
LELDFVLEVGCEEIPARLVEGALEQLKQKFAASLDRHVLTHSPILSFATPRRLILGISDLTERQPDRNEVITGPPYSVAFGPNGEPTGAALGFASKFQLAVDHLRCIETERGRYVGFEKRVSGLTSEAILVKELPQILGSLEFPKKMHWEETQFFFVRPIRWLLCLVGGRVVPFSVASVETANRTFGHRILSGNNAIEVSSLEEFQRSLLTNKVIFDPEVRRTAIRKALHDESGNLHSKLLEDDSLLDLVVYLNEHPTVICGSFDREFLRLPKEVLVTVMREHQKYFSLVDSAGQLLPKFFTVVDSDGVHAEKIKAGHERVLKARLADASFFWDVDRKVSLEGRVEKLGRVIFQVKLGTVLEKTSRLVTLVDFLARLLRRRDLIDELKRAARLCKADLTTEMVKEFTDLQGIMGGLYARAEGLPESLAKTIYEHYRPVTLEDRSPETLGGALLSVADKLDSVVGAFSIGLVPTGSKDPLALRRQTTGFIKVLLDHEISISLKRTFERSISLYRKRATRTAAEAHQDFEAFVKERLKYIFKARAYRYDEVNAVVEIAFDNPLDCLKRVRAISSMRESADFGAVAQSFKRITNILVKSDETASNSVNPILFENDAERELNESIERIGGRVQRACQKGEYQRAFELMVSLRLPIDQFFDEVLVIAENDAVRENRLSLLKKLRGIFLKVADVSEIVSSS